MRMNRTLIGIAVVVLALQAAPARAARETSGQTKLRTVNVIAQFKEKALTLDGVDCRPSAAQRSVQEVCKLHLVGPSTFTGTIDAKVSLDYLAWPDGVNLRYTGTDYIVGSVAGCGTGSFVIDYPEGLVNQDRFNPMTQGEPGWNTWVLRKGSGTGGLTNLVSGSGEMYFTAYPLRGHDQSETFANGDITGTFTCAIPQPRPRARGPHTRKR